MTEYTVSISIVTYNSEKHIGKLLDSIIQKVHGIKYHIYVIDNGSADSTAEIVKHRSSPCITWIQSDKNRGFGGGHNLVLKYIESDYHLCVNPDIVISSDVAADMARYMDEHGDVGILTPKILNMDGSVQMLPKKNPRLVYLIARRVNLHFLKKYCNEYEMLDKNADEKFDIEFCSGCFMFMRTALFKTLVGFDERFFLYFEDADLTRRIRKTARAEYNPAFSVIHCWERAGSKKLKYFLIQVASMIKYMIKWRRPEKV